MVGNSDSDRELNRNINKLIQDQTKIDKRVERLESLEFHNRASGLGCIEFVDYDIDWIGKAQFEVEFLNSPLPSGDESHSQTTIFWALMSHEETPMVNLYMRFGIGVPIARASYNYAYKYSKGLALTQGALDAQTEWFIGRIPGAENPYVSVGEVTVPFHSAGAFHRVAKGDWAAYQLGSPLNSREEKGEWGGSFVEEGGGLIARNFFIFPSAGNIEGMVYLYGWCPSMTDVSGPSD